MQTIKLGTYCTQYCSPSRINIESLQSDCHKRRKYNYVKENVLKQFKARIKYNLKLMIAKPLRIP